MRMKNKLLIIITIFFVFSCKQKEETFIYNQTNDELTETNWFDIEEFWSNKEKGENIEYFLEDSIFVEESWSRMDNQYERYCYFRKKNIITHFVYNSSGEIISKKSFGVILFILFLLRNTIFMIRKVILFK